MTLKSDDRRALIDVKIDKANKAIDDVKFLIENNKLELAVNRIYYGLFYIVSALALNNSFSTNKHQQLIGWFNKQFVRTDKVANNYGRILHKAFDKRTKSDYDDFVEFEIKEVELMYAEMIDFISVVTKLI